MNEKQLKQKLRHHLSFSNYFKFYQGNYNSRVTIQFKKQNESNLATFNYTLQLLSIYVIYFTNIYIKQFIL